MGGNGDSAATSRVSVASDGAQGNDRSYDPKISASGQYVVYSSFAANLVPGDTNNTQDIFLRDRWTHTTSRVSVASDGAQANGGSYSPAISADGRYVVFGSSATNLVPGDCSCGGNIYVRDRWAGTTTRVSVSSDGTDANGSSYAPGTSGDGRYVVFGSEASNLVPGDTNGTWDIFVRDWWAGTTTRVNVSSDGRQANDFSFGAAISADGRYVVFGSVASNLVPGDTNDTYDIFVQDLSTRTTSRVDVSSDGAQANGGFYSYTVAISANGRYVAFGSVASNLVPGDTNGSQDIFVRDRRTGTTSRVSLASDGTQANGHSMSTAISSDGRWVVFGALASNLVPGDTNGSQDVFLRNQWTGSTSRVSVASDGTQANGDSFFPAVSNNRGPVVVFGSVASNLVRDDTNNTVDTFVRSATRR